MMWYNRTLIRISIGIFFAVQGWVLHTALESCFSPEKSFFQLMISDVTLFDLILRGIVSGSFFLASIFLLNAFAYQQQIKDDLKKSKEALQETIMLLEQKLQEKTTEVDNLILQKKDLILGLSHDLKTPLTPLMGFLPMVVKEEKDPKLKELLEISLRNVHYMRDLVSRTIDLALLDSTIVGFSKEKTNLLSEFESVIDHRSYILQNHHIFVDNQINPQVFVDADKQKLREVLNNILLNSVKYSSPSGGTITLRTQQKEEEVIVSVIDTGIGLSEQQRSHIFDELYKGDSARQDHASTGLGLAICKRIIEKHGGKIWAESAGLGKGTTVFFTLPTYKGQ